MKSACSLVALSRLACLNQMCRQPAHTSHLTVPIRSSFGLWTGKSRLLGKRRFVRALGSRCRFFVCWFNARWRCTGFDRSDHAYSLPSEWSYAFRCHWRFRLRTALRCFLGVHGRCLWWPVAHVFLSGG